MSYKFNATCLKVSLSALLLLFFQSGFAQLDKESLNYLVEQKVKATKNEVVVVAGTKDTVVYQKDTKTFSAARGDAPIGAVSQLFTTALVLMYVDQGLLSLDDKVVQYLPEFEKYGKNYITIRHCLTNYTGIRMETKNGKISSLENEVKAMAAREIQSNPGTEARYTDKGFLIVARIVEVVGKKKFEMLVQQKLLRPLNMRKTTFNTLDGSAPNPATGARSSATDLMIFLRMLLNNGEWNGVKYLSAEAMAELRKIHNEAGALKNPPKSNSSFSYALGSFATEEKDGVASALVAHSYEGTSAYIDFCRGYAFVYLLKELNDDAKADALQPLRNEFETAFGDKCK